MEQFEGFGYFNIEHRATAWNVYTGLLQSASYVKSEAETAISMFMASMLDTDAGADRWPFEQWLEGIRMTEFPRCVSRLEGLFLFDTPESALMVLEADWGRHFAGQQSHFHSSCLSDVGVSCRGSSRHDANWITYMGRAWRSLNPAERRDAARQYWNGHPCSTMGLPVWERLVDGYAVLWGTDLRERAKERLIGHSVSALAVLEFARLAVHLGETVGQIQPFLWSNETALHLEYRMDYRIVEKDPAGWDRRLAQYAEENPHLVDWPALTGSGWRVPDLTQYSREWKFPRGG